MSRQQATRCVLGILACAGIGSTQAQQIDIAGPPGGVNFGRWVAALPNGNIVVAAPYETVAGLARVGAVYVYDSNRNLISTLTGSSANDQIGFEGLFVLPSGNVVITSKFWTNGRRAKAGAVTWINGQTGLSGVVSAENSLVGTRGDDEVGTVTILRNGNYVVSSPRWDNGAIVDAGASTWVNGETGLSGPVSTANSLVGSNAGDQVSLGCDVVNINSFALQQTPALRDGNYLVCSKHWKNGTVANAGAVTWGNGETGLVGTVNTANSMTGSSENDHVGGRSGGGMSIPGEGKMFTELDNGNYVIANDDWHDASGNKVGAVTWVSSTSPLVGPVSAGNSLTGGSASFDGSYSIVTPLRNGNYVVSSPFWPNGSVEAAGAVTWANGATGRTGVVSPAISLVGSDTYDCVGGVVALTDGNYIVHSPNWKNQGIYGAGAVTWGNGSGGTTGIVSPANSLVGTHFMQSMGGSVTALRNGRYLISSNHHQSRGAVTFAHGDPRNLGEISAANSLVGSTMDDYVGERVIVLSNGNYVVVSSRWRSATANFVGAVTWGSADSGVFGEVSAANSLIGSSEGDGVGGWGVTPLPNGNYVVISSEWDRDGVRDVGAVTWGNGRGGTVGVVSESNSLVGSFTDDFLGRGRVVAYANSSYTIDSPSWSDIATPNANGVGAMSLGRGNGGLVGTINRSNSIIGAVFLDSQFANYDVARDLLISGRPRSNVVSLLRTDALFADDF